MVQFRLAALERIDDRLWKRFEASGHRCILADCLELAQELGSVLRCVATRIFESLEWAGRHRQLAQYGSLNLEFVSVCFENRLLFFLIGPALEDVSLVP